MAAAVAGRPRAAAPPRLAELLLDSGDERVRLEAAKTILDRHLGRPAIEADATSVTRMLTRL